MVSNKVVTNALSIVLKAESAAVIQSKLANNIWATPSRDSPNGEKLQDGAIQRASVSVPRDKLAWTHMNPEKIGAYKRPELNTKASITSMKNMAPWDTQMYRHKIARIYMPQKKHLHCHPTNKTAGKYWAIEFDSWGTYKSPLMGWTSASMDTYQTVQMKFGKL